MPFNFYWGVIKKNIEGRNFLPKNSAAPTNLFEKDWLSASKHYDFFKQPNNKKVKRIAIKFEVLNLQKLSMQNMDMKKNKTWLSQ